MGNCAALRADGGSATEGMTHRAIHGADLRSQAGTDGQLGQAIERTALPLQVCAGGTNAGGPRRSAGTPLARIPRAGVDIYNGHHASPELNATLKRRKSLARKRSDPCDLDGAQAANFRRNQRSAPVDRSKLITPEMIEGSS